MQHSIIQSICFFAGYKANFERMLKTISKATGVKAMEKSISGILLPVGSLSLQVGSRLTPATNLPKASPLDSGKCSALRFSHFQKAERQ